MCIKFGMNQLFLHVLLLPLDYRIIYNEQVIMVNVLITC